MIMKYWKELVGVGGFLISVSALSFSVNRVSEEGAVGIERRLTSIEKDVGYNARYNAQTFKNTEKILEKLEGQNGFMNDTSRVVDYTCERITGCMERYGPLKIPN